MNINNSEIKELPKNLNVEQLYMIDSLVQQLPNNLQSQHIYAQYSSLEKLPEKIVGLKSLNISYTKISKLPNQLDINFLVMKETPIKSLPQDMKVNDLYISSKQFELFKDNLPVGVKNIHVQEF